MAGERSSSTRANSRFREIDARRVVPGMTARLKEPTKTLKAGPYLILDITPVGRVKIRRTEGKKGTATLSPLHPDVVFQIPRQVLK
ncbi:MAG: hypothetical protein V4449_03245 [Patescibacteria group bacterium]